MLRLRALAAALALLVFAGCASAQQTTRSPNDLARAIDRVLDADDVAQAHWGVVVIDLDRRAELYARNDERWFVPASTLKLFSTAAALDQLGPDFRFHTDLYAFGDVRDGVLHGSLVARGAGDPSMSPHFHDGDPTQIFRRWASDLRAAGITRIDGPIVGDDDLLDDVPLGVGWAWDDEPYWYSAQIGALTFNDNTVDLRVEGHTAGAPADITWKPVQTTYLDVTNASLTTPAGTGIDEDYRKKRGGNALTVATRVAEGRVETEAIAVDDPTAYFAHVLREVLIEEGIAVSGPALDADVLPLPLDYREARAVARYTSPPLREIVEVVNVRSHNLFAELVLRAPAAQRDGAAEVSWRDGVRQAGATWSAAGVDTAAVRIVDGSGLSRMNLVTPDALASLLGWMYTSADPAARDAFVSSLPTGGVDGTLQGRFTSGPARGNVRAKTGTLTGVSALAGYVTSASGRRMAFAIMCNNYTVPTRRVRAAQDAVVELLARYR